MSLHKIKDFDPEYPNSFDEDIIGLDLYSSDEKIGKVEDMLVEDDGTFRYFVIDTPAWIAGKKTLLPLGCLRIDRDAHRASVGGLTKAQIERLPAFDEHGTIDYDREEQTRAVYRTADATVPPTTADTYNYHQDAELYALDRADLQTLKLYQERLVANKIRRKTGEVTIGKHIETKTATVSIQIDKERVVIERTPGDPTKPIDPHTANFQAGEFARLEIYEEVPDIHPETFVREEVSIHKEVDREIVSVQEILRREELDIDCSGSATPTQTVK